MANNVKQDLTQGSIWRYIATLSVPVTIGMAFQSMYTIVDLYWVGRLGTASVAAITLAGSLFFLFFSVAQVLGAGTLAIVARAFGQKDTGRAVHTVRNVGFVSLILGAAFGVACFIFAERIVSLLGGRGEVVLLGGAYLRPFALGFGFQIISFVLNFSMRGAGDMKSPMYAMVIATTVNIVLDPLLIFGPGPFPEWGVAGAGVATMIATAISAVYVFIVIISGASQLHVPIITKFSPDWPVIWEVLRIGIPAGLQFLFLSLSFMVLIWIVSDYGAAAIAAAGIGWRLMHMSIIPVIGIGTAVATLVGQNLGAERPDRATRATQLGITAACFCAAVIALSFASFPDFFMKIFSESNDVLLLGRDILRVLAVNEILMGVAITLNNTFSGAGDNTPPMIGAIVRSFFAVSLAFLLPRITPYGLVAIWSSIPISTLINLFILVYIYRRGNWKTRMKKLEEKTCLARYGAPVCPAPPPD